MSNVETDSDEGSNRKERAARSQGMRGLTMFTGRIKGRNAVITGGASGLGLVCAKCILEENRRVALRDSNPQAPAENKVVLHEIVWAQ